MKRHAILVGAISPEKGLQKSLVDFKDFLTSEAGGAWREDEIMITGPLPWQFVQLLQSRLREYDFVLIYVCRNSHGKMLDDDFSEKLKSVASVFIQDECTEIVPEDMAEENATDVFPKFSRTEARMGF